MRFSLAAIESSFDALVLFLATGAFQTKLVDIATPQRANGGSSMLQAVWSCIYIVVLIRVIQNRRRILAVLRKNKALAILIALPLISILWSGAPGLTFRSGVGVVLTTLFGLDFALRRPIQDQLRVLEPVLICAVAAGVIAEVFFPGLFPPADFGNNVGDPNAWNGVFVHKNTFGHVIALTTLVALVRTPHSRLGALLRYAWILITFAVAFKSHSMTALGLMLIMPFSIGWVLSRQRKGFGLKVGELSVVVLIAGMVLYFAIHHLNGASGPLGRDSTLTGRTELWHYSLESAAKRPVLGYGYRAFWNVSTEADRIRQVIGWDAPHAHNAYIESVLGLGVIGLTVYLIASFVAIKRAIIFARFEQGKERSWPLAFLVFTLLYGLTEAPPMSPNNLLWILFVAAACVVSRVPAYRTVPRRSEVDQMYEGQLVMQH